MKKIYLVVAVLAVALAVLLAPPKRNDPVLYDIHLQPAHIGDNQTAGQIDISK
jgi:hypothetical protein